MTWWNVVARRRDVVGAGRAGWPAAAAMIGAAAVLAVACTPKWKVERIEARVGSVVDVHGNTGLSALPAPCQSPTPAFPPLPMDWWNGLLARQRVGAAVVGYQVWQDTVSAHAPPTCPKSLRTDVYRGFFELDLSRYIPPPPAVNQAGSIAKAVLVLEMKEVYPVMTPAALAQPMTSPTASILCDPQTGSAFDLRRVPPAVSFFGGMTQNLINSNTAFLTNPPIPTGYPAGTRIYAFPTKNPALNPNLAQPIEIDITQAVVSTLQQNATRMVFMLTGTTDPQIGNNGTVQRTDAPLAQPDCRTTFHLALDVSTP
jgi:hypothetical protein